MAVITYSLKKDKDTKLSTNFKVGEFRCKDGSDVIKIDTELVEVLQKIRTHFKKAVTINSAYRTEKYNKSIGGASKSQHIYGKAADITVKGVDPVSVAIYASEVLGTKGGVELGSYGEGFDGYVHIDVRDSKWRGIIVNRNSKYTTYQTFPPTVMFGSTGDAVVVISRKLKKLGYLSTVMTKCNGIMHNAIKQFQANNELKRDGIFGKKSWEKLADVLK